MSWRSSRYCQVTQPLYPRYKRGFCEQVGVDTPLLHVAREAALSSRIQAI